MAVTACGSDPDMQTVSTKQAVTVPKHDPVEARPQVALAEFKEVRHERAARYATTYHFVQTVSFMRTLEQQKREDDARREEANRQAAQRTVVATSNRTSEPAVRAPSQPISGGSIWYALAQCESSGNWAINTGNGFYGGLQFTLQSWHAMGGSGYPHQASPAEQISRGQALQSVQGWGAWPACSAKLGLR